MIISAFFDESGKFKDHSTVAFAGVAGVADNLTKFCDEWRRHLRLNGLESLTMKKALNHKSPLSPKRAAKGITNRLDALLPFAVCIRRHLQNVLAFAIDVVAFKGCPERVRNLWGNDPHYMVFTRVLLEVMKALGEGDSISIVCDDEEDTAFPMYRLYRRIKIVSAEARKKLASISFADDRVFYGLQAADFVASLTRLQAGEKFFSEGHEYGRLWEELGKPQHGDNLWGFSGCMIDRAMINGVAEGILDLRRLRPAEMDRLRLTE
jgi:hypothetical protein